MKETKSQPITKRMVWEAYKRVKSNGGSAGIDNVSLDKYEENLSKNLYKLWNRLSSGSYFPPRWHAPCGGLKNNRRWRWSSRAVSTFKRLNSGAFYRRDKRERTTSVKNTVTETRNALTSQDVSALLFYVK